MATDFSRNDQTSRRAQPGLLLLGSQMAAGGAQHILFIQATWYRDNGYRVVVAFFHDKEGLRAQWMARHGIEIVDLRSWREEANVFSNLLRLLSGCYRLFRLISRERFDVVETFTHHANLIGLPVAWLAGVPKRIATDHGRPLNFGPALVRLHTYLANTRIVTDVVAVSEHLRQELVDNEGIRAEKISVIYNGISGCDSKLDVRSAARRVRSELGVPESGHLVLSVGRLVPEKAHSDLLEAVPTILEQFPNTIVAIAGDGALRDPLQRRIQELSLEKVVLLLGTRTDVWALLAAADLFAYPSVSEGCPLALLEALSMRVAIVASNFDGLTNLLEHEETALLTPTRDPQAFAAALVTALGSRELRRRLACAGADLVARKFSVATMCQSYEGIFRAG